VSISYSQRQALIANARQRLAREKANIQKNVLLNTTVSERLVDTFEEAFGNVIYGALKGLEGVYDSALSIGGEKNREKIAYDWSGDVFGKDLAESTKLTYSKDFSPVVQRIYSGVSQGVGQMLPSIALSAIPYVGTALSLGYLGMSGAGNAMEEGFQTDADYGATVLYGVLSGATEILTEKIGGGLTKGVYGKGFVDDLVNKVVQNKVFKYAVDVAEEGVEEAIATAVNPILKKITIDPSNQEFASPEHVKQIFEDAIIGSLTAVAFSSTLGSALRTKGVRTAEDQAEIESLEKKRGNLESRGKLTEEIEGKINQRILELKGNQSVLLNKMNAEHATRIKQRLNISKNFDEKNMVLKSEPFVGNKGSVSSVTRSKGIKLAYETSDQNLTQDELKVMNNLNKISGTQIGLARVKGMSESTEATYDPETNMVYISEKASGRDTAKNVYRAMLIHEVTHSMEGTVEYSKFAEALRSALSSSKTLSKRITGKSYSDIVQEIVENYHEEGRDVREDFYVISTEIVSRYTEDLFSDEFVIERLTRENRTISQKIFNWVKDKIRIFKNGKTPEEREYLEFLSKAEKLYAKALERSIGGVDIRNLRKMIVGKEATKEDEKIKKSFDTAQQMFDAKFAYCKTAADEKNLRIDILRRTGWYQEVNSRWNYKITDKDAEINEDIVSLIEKEDSENQEFYLSDVFDHPRLYRIYPELKDVIVRFENHDDGLAQFSISEKTITINKKVFADEEFKKLKLSLSKKFNLFPSAENEEEYKKTRPDSKISFRDWSFARANLKEKIDMRFKAIKKSTVLKATLLHEIQHAVQGIEDEPYVLTPFLNYYFHDLLLDEMQAHYTQYSTFMTEAEVLRMNERYLDNDLSGSIDVLNNSIFAPYYHAFNIRDGKIQETVDKLLAEKNRMRKMVVGKKFGGTALEEAVKMNQAGVGPQKIFEETGWWRNPFDKQWRFWIKQDEVTMSEDRIKEIFRTFEEAEETGEIPVYNLEDLFADKKLFEIYPEMRTLRVRIDNSIENAAQYDESNKSITVSFAEEYEFYKNRKNYIKNRQSTTPANFKDKVLQEETVRVEQYAFDPIYKVSLGTLRFALIHELQHYIQEVENFARGTNQFEAIEIGESFFKKLFKETKEYEDIINKIAEYETKDDFWSITRTEELQYELYKKEQEYASKFVNEQHGFDYYKNFLGEREARFSEEKSYEDIVFNDLKNYQKNSIVFNNGEVLRWPEIPFRSAERKMIVNMAETKRQLLEEMKHNLYPLNVDYIDSGVYLDGKLYENNLGYKDSDVTNCGGIIIYSYPGKIDLYMNSYIDLSSDEINTIIKKIIKNPEIEEKIETNIIYMSISGMQVSSFKYDLNKNMNNKDIESVSLDISIDMMLLNGDLDIDITLSKDQSVKLIERIKENFMVGDDINFKKTDWIITDGNRMSQTGPDKKKIGLDVLFPEESELEKRFLNLGQIKTDYYKLDDDEYVYEISLCKEATNDQIIAIKKIVTEVYKNKKKKDFSLNVIISFMDENGELLDSDEFDADDFESEKEERLGEKVAESIIMFDYNGEGNPISEISRDYLMTNRFTIPIPDDLDESFVGEGRLEEIGYTEFPKYEFVIKKAKEDPNLKIAKPYDKDEFGFVSCILDKEGEIFAAMRGDHTIISYSLLGSKYIISQKAKEQDTSTYRDFAIKKLTDFGFIRMYNFGDSFSFTFGEQKPTEEQFKTFRTILENNVGNPTSIGASIKGTYRNFVWERNESPDIDGIIEKIKDFYREGDNYVSPLLQFRDKRKFNPNVKYTKSEARDIIARALLDQVNSNENHPNLLPKTFSESVRRLFEMLKTSTNKELVVKKIAKFIVNNALMQNDAEGKNIFGQDTKLLQDYELLRNFVQSFDLSKIKDEIKNRSDKSTTIFQRWGVRRDATPITINEFKDTIKDSIVIQTENDVDFIINLNEYFERVKKEFQDTVSNQRKLANENDFFVDITEERIQDEIRKGILESGEVFENKYEKYIKKLEKDLAKTAAQLTDARIRSKTINNILAVAEQIGNFQNHLPADLKLAEQVVSSIKLLKKAGTSSGNLSPQIRSIMRLYSATHEGASLYSVVTQSEGIRYYYADSIENIANGNGKLTTEELTDLYNILKDFVRSVREFNKVFFEGQQQEDTELADRAIQDIKEVIKVKKGWFSRFKNWLHSPVRVFDRMSNYKKSGMMNRFFAEFERGLDDFARFRMQSAELFKEYIKQHAHEMDTWREEKSYNGVKMSKGQAISLYLTFLRDKTIGHLFNIDQMSGVIRIANETNSEKKEYKDAQQNGHDEQITYELMEEIQKSLTKEDEEFIKLIRDFFDLSGKAKLETDKKIYGITSELELNYFPVRVSSDQIYQSVGEEDFTFSHLFTIYNPSFNKDVRPNSSKKVVIENVLDVINRHADQMASYYGFAQPIKAFNRVWNKKVNGTTLREEVQAVDPTFQDYVKKLLKDVQGQVETRSEFDKFIATIRNWSATASLGLNPKVWANQLVSLFAAHGVGFNYDDLVYGMSVALSGKTDFDALIENSPMMYERFREGNNIDVGRIKEGKGVLSKTDKLIDYTLKPITKIDRLVIGGIWNAALKVSGKDKKKAAKMVEEAVIKTQANYTALYRPAILRERSSLLSMFTMYMSEPLQVFSMFAGSVEKLSVARKLKELGDPEADNLMKEAKAEFGRSIVTIGVDTTLLALIASCFKWVKKDDDEEEKFFNNFMEEFLGIVFGTVPFIRDFYSLAQGYELSNPTYTGLNSIYNALELIGGVFTDLVSGKVQDTEQITKSLHDVLVGITTVFGIPTRNLENYLKGIIYKFAPTSVEEYNSYIETRTNSYYLAEIQKAYDKEDFESAERILSIMLRQKNSPIEDEGLSSEMAELLSKGYDAMPIALDDSIVYEGDVYTLNAKQFEQFKAIYSRAESYAVRLLASSQYKIMNDENKAKAIKKIYQYCYNLAKEDFFGEDINGKFGEVAEKIPVETLTIVQVNNAFLEADKDINGNSISGTKKAKMTRLINSLKLTEKQKSIVYEYLNYTM